MPYTRGALAVPVFAVLAAAAAPATAQHLRERPDNGFVGAVSVPVDRATRECATPLAVRGADALRDWTCAVEFLRPLGTADSVGWLAARYCRGGVYRDTIYGGHTEWDEIVLFTRAPNAQLVQPVWHILTERTFEFLTDVKAEPRAEGLLIELLICLNGTGGCGRHYLLTNGNELRVVAMPFVASLIDRLPEDHRLHKGVTLDLTTLRGTWPVAVSGDGNCCPSKAFDYEVRLDGASMLLVRATLRDAGLPPAIPRFP